MMVPISQQLLQPSRA
ncbi:rCG48692, partial [Rattus norvegicus]